MSGRSLFVAAISVASLISSIPAAATESNDAPTNGRDVVLAGIYSDQWQSGPDAAALSTASTNALSLMGTFHHLRESEDGWEGTTDWLLEQAWSAETTPFANLELSVSAADVGSGAYDADIQQWAMRVKAWLDRGDGRSLLIAPMQEMNGDWVPWGMDPAGFRIAFRRFVEIFAGIGINETQVRWVFAPNGHSTSPYKMSDYYPGDDVVDFLGISAYNFGTSRGGQWSGVPVMVGSALDELRTISPYKPYLVTQVGSSTRGGDRDAWIRELFQLAADDPNVVGFIYFNFNKETDWKLWDGTNAAPGWLEGMHMPSTIHRWPLTGWFQPGPIAFAPHEGMFADDDTLASQNDIEWLVAKGITEGCAAHLFCPQEVITREQLATFLARAFQLPTSSVDLFTDDNGTPHEGDINALVAAGISSGCAADLFCPTELVTRQELASALVAALHLPKTAVDRFRDDPDSPYEADINALVAAGIASGCTADLFCPLGAVSREEMASFLRRSLEPSPPRRQLEWGLRRFGGPF